MTTEMVEDTPFVVGSFEKDCQATHDDGYHHTCRLLDDGHEDHECVCGTTWPAPARSTLRLAALMVALGLAGVLVVSAALSLALR